jgi:hypothetical protein
MLSAWTLAKERHAQGQTDERRQKGESVGAL